jgi:hypothetical protein
MLHENLFHIKYHMSFEAFNKLVNLLEPNLKLNERFARLSSGEPVSCKAMLHCTICYLAGGSYHDIWETAKVSRASYYRVIWHTNNVINSCNELEIKLPRQEELNKLREALQMKPTWGVMNGCVGILDGYLMQITAPSSDNECGNVSTYFSVHYCTYGVNVQAMCDADC